MGGLRRTCQGEITVNSPGLVLRALTAAVQAVPRRPTGAGRTDGAVLSAVTASGPADEAGLQPIDVVVRVGERAVTDADSLIVAVRASDPGSSVEVTYRRGGQESTVAVVLGEAPASWPARLPPPYSGALRPGAGASPEVVPEMTQSSAAGTGVDWRTAGVRVVPPDGLDPNTAQTAGMQRAAAVGERTGAVGLWAGTVTIEPGARTGVHSHGELESVIYVVHGRARMRWGDALEFVAEAGPGSFVFVPPHVPHQEINASGDEPLHCVVVRNSQEPVVIAVDVAAADEPVEVGPACAPG